MSPTNFGGNPKSFRAKKGSFLTFQATGRTGRMHARGYTGHAQIFEARAVFTKTRPDTDNPFWVMFRMVKLLYNTYAV